MTGEPMVRALSGREVGELTLAAVRRGELSVADLRIHPETLERQAAVAEYLKSVGITGNRVIVAEGANPNVTHSTAYQMQKLYSKDGAAFTGQSADDTSSGGSAMGAAAPGGH